MKRFFALLLVTSALSVRAQTLAPLAIRLASDSTSDLYTFSQNQCRDSVSLVWVYNALGTSQLCTDMKIWGTEGECGDAPQSSDAIYDPISRAVMLTTKQGTFDVSLESLPGLKEGSSTPCGTADLQKTHKICGVV